MELKILHWFEELHNPVLDFLMYQITCLGNGGFIWLVIAAAMLPKRYRKTGATVVAALLISLVICNGIMKNLYQRVRPFHADTTFENLYRVFDRIYDWSFPSGHTSASFAAAVAIRLWNKKEGACGTHFIFKAVSDGSLSDRCTGKCRIWFGIRRGSLSAYEKGA